MNEENYKGVTYNPNPKAFERCPHCMEESEIGTELKPYKCKVCGRYIAPCSQCDVMSCDGCLVEAECKKLNKEFEGIPTAEAWLDTCLEDDDTEVGGTAFLGETLGDFLESVWFDEKTPMDIVNMTLVGCGIKPIEYKQ